MDALNKDSRSDRCVILKSVVLQFGPKSQLESKNLANFREGIHYKPKNRWLKVCFFQQLIQIVPRCLSKILKRIAKKLSPSQAAVSQSVHLRREIQTAEHFYKSLSWYVKYDRDNFYGSNSSQI